MQMRNHSLPGQSHRQTSLAHVHSFFLCGNPHWPTPNDLAQSLHRHKNHLPHWCSTPSWHATLHWQTNPTNMAQQNQFLRQQKHLYLLITLRACSTLSLLAWTSVTPSRTWSVAFRTTSARSISSGLVSNSPVQFSIVNSTFCMLFTCSMLVQQALKAKPMHLLSSVVQPRAMGREKILQLMHHDAERVSLSQSISCVKKNNTKNQRGMCFRLHKQTSRSKHMQAWAPPLPSFERKISIGCVHL